VCVSPPVGRFSSSSRRRTSSFFVRATSDSRRNKSCSLLKPALEFHGRGSLVALDEDNTHNHCQRGGNCCRG
jgi:hypothetical protein